MVLLLALVLLLGVCWVIQRWRWWVRNPGWLNFSRPPPKPKETEHEQKLRRWKANNEPQGSYMDPKSPIWKDERQRLGLDPPD
jgi:hypothetical protein